MRLIDADAPYERATTLEAQALDYVGKLIERDGDEPSVEWKIWSAILTERTAFKHDLMDAPTIDRPHGEWIWDKDGMDWNIGAWICSECHARNANLPNYKQIVPLRWSGSKFCPNCGARMKGDRR